MEESTSRLVTGDDFGRLAQAAAAECLPPGRRIDRSSSSNVICIGKCWCNAPNQNVESEEKKIRWGLHREQPSEACTVFYGKEIFKCHSINYLFAMLGVWSSALRSPSSSPLSSNIYFTRCFDSSVGRSQHCQSESDDFFRFVCNALSRCRSYNGVIFNEIEKEIDFLQIFNLFLLPEKERHE